MKKFLAILLIAMIACSNVSVVEEEEFKLEVVIQTVQGAIQFLIKIGVWDLIMNFLKTHGKKFAYNLCVKYIKAGWCKAILKL